MSLNAWTVSTLFLSVVTAGLGLLLAIVALRSLAQPRATAALEGDEDRTHLLGLIVGVLIGIKLLAWPLFYGLLESFVPGARSSGVMCAFGIAQLDPLLVSTLEWIKPITLLSLGAWVSLQVASRRANDLALLRPLLFSAAVLALLVLVDSGTEMAYVLRERAESAVTCCSQFIDTQTQGYSTSPGALTSIGGGSRAGNLMLLAAVHLGLVAFVRFAWRREQAAPKPLVLALVAAFGGLNLVIAHGIWSDTIAPVVLQLPYHHCLYEVVTRVPLMGVAAGLTVLGCGALAWPLLLAPFRKRAPVQIAEVQRSIARCCSIAVVSALLIVLTHTI